MMQTIAAVTIAACAMAAAPASAWDKLVDADTFADIADEVVVVDIRSPDAFAAGHIPGAVSAPYPAWRGPAHNPGEVMSDERLTALLQGLGLDYDDQVVVAHTGRDQTDFGAAARVYWTLKSAGFPTLAILDGGVAGFEAAGYALSTDAVAVEPSTQTFTLADTYLADRDDVAEIAAGKRNATLLDARPTAFFGGAAKHPAASTGGTIATAGNFPFAAWFAGDETAIGGAASAEAIAAKAPIGEGEIVSFCNTGHWAATNWFALSELAGRENVKLYAESVVGWLNDGGSVAPGK